MSVMTIAQSSSTKPPWKGSTFNASPKLPAAQIRDLAALRWLHSGESVILFGPVDVGKTHVAQALGHLAIRQGAGVRFAKTSRILAELADGHADRTWDKRIRELIRPDLLILDDFAMRQLTAPQADDLYELVSERQGRSLIITSNRAPSDWFPLFPNPVVAESLLDRLINASHQVIMNGPSYRPNKRPKNPTDKPARPRNADQIPGGPASIRRITGGRRSRSGPVWTCRSSHQVAPASRSGPITSLAFTASDDVAPPSTSSKGRSAPPIRCSRT